MTPLNMLRRPWDKFQPRFWSHKPDIFDGKLVKIAAMSVQSRLAAGGTSPVGLWQLKQVLNAKT